MALLPPGVAGGGMLGMPGHVQLGPYWFRVAIDAKGAPLYRQRPAPFYPAQVNQADMGEAQVSPDGRLPFSLRDLSQGAGLAQQPLLGELKQFDRCGDAEGEGIDASLTPGGPLILSALLYAPALAGFPPESDLVGALWHGGWPNAYLSAGNHVYTHDGEGVASLGDFGLNGSGQKVIATDGITSFLGVADITGAETWYQPVGYADPMRYSPDGGHTWLNCGTTGGLTGGVGSACEVDGEVVVATKSPRRGSAMVAVFEDGGANPTLFNVIDPIGDAAIPISRLLVFHGRVLVFKDREGIFLLTSDRRSLEDELFPELRGDRIYYHGATVWRGILWLPTMAGLYAVTPGLGLQKAGPAEAETSSLAPRAPKGPVTAVAGDAHNLYAFRESPDGPSWVYKANVEVSGGGIQDIAWFPWSQQADCARCRFMMTVAPGPVGAPGDPPDAERPRLLFGRHLIPGTGTPPVSVDTYNVGWYCLPGMGRDPRTDTRYEYCHAGTLYYTRLQARFPAINKAWYSLTPLTAPMEYKLDGVTPTSAHTLRLRWKADITLPDPADANLGYAEGIIQRSGPGTRNPLTPPIYARGFDLALRIDTLDKTTTPQVYSVTAEYDLRPLPVWRHEMTLDLSSGAYSTTGQSGFGDPLRPSRALLALRGVTGASGAIALSDEWGNQYDVSVPVDGVSLRAASGGEAGYQGEVPLLVDVVAVEQRTRAIGTWRVVALYTWRQISYLTWGQLPELG
jgi:hypothetical protein